MIIETLLEVGQAVAVFLLFMVVHAVGVARERGRKPVLSLLCGCHHELSFHNGLGACKYVDWSFLRDKRGRPKRQANGDYVTQDTPCLCQQYTGDLPEDFFSRDAMRSGDL